MIRSDPMERVQAIQKVSKQIDEIVEIDRKISEACRRGGMEGAANKPAAAAAAAAALEVEDLGGEMEMETLLQGLLPPPLKLNKPHELVRQGDDVLVAIASVEELNAALAAAPPDSINIKGVLRGYVLPTASCRDCVLLKAAAEEGLYRYGGAATPTPAVKFGLADHAVVDAKIGARASVDEARAVLDGVVSSLTALAISTPAGDESTTTNAAAAAATTLAPDTFESVRQEAQQRLESTIAHIMALRERLDSI